MAGHSQFKNIMFRKGAQDAKRAKLFTKIQREIVVAVKKGAPDPATNPGLRAALIKARKENMPKDKIESAIKRGTGADASDDYVEVRYEGYGPGGVAVIVEALTDNRNRTAADVRSAFTKNGGNLGETGSVSFMFERLGEVVYPLARVTPDAMFEAAIEAGADNVETEGEFHTVTCAPENLHAVRDFLSQKFGDPESAKLTWKPSTTAPLNAEQAASLYKMLDVLEDNDDVQHVFSNDEVSEEDLKKLAG